MFLTSVLFSPCKSLVIKLLAAPQLILGEATSGEKKQHKCDLKASGKLWKGSTKEPSQGSGVVKK